MSVSTKIIAKRTQARPAAITHLEVVPGILIEIENVEQRSVGRAALGNDVGASEHLECADHAGQKGEEDDGRSHGQGDVSELGPRAGPVQHRRFVKYGRYPLQAGQIEDHVAPQPPQTHDDEAGNHPLTRSKPLRPFDVNAGQKVVDQTDLRVENPCKQIRGGDSRRNHRQVEYSGERSQPPSPPG